MGSIIFIVFVSLAISFVLWWRLRYRFKKPVVIQITQWPHVSVIIPFRNEAHQLAACLAALAALDYPTEQLEVVLGDDQSTDETLSLLHRFATLQANKVKVISIQTGDLNLRNGKTNALMQLVAASSGELLLFTDADCEVPPSWVKSMVSCWQTQRVDLVTGITGMQSAHWYGRQQGLDWFFILGIVKVMEDLGFHTTSLGNNMLISRAAYASVGGFRALPFTLTEDFEIAKNIQQRGFGIFHLVSAQNYISTKPELHPLRMLLQRKRWISAVVQLNPLWIMGLAFRVLMPLALINLAFQKPVLALICWILHLGLQAGILRWMFQKTTTKVYWRDLVLFDLYFIVNTLASLSVYFWPSKVPWKERQY